VAQGGDHILALKDNHPTLHDDVRAIFAAARATDVAPRAAPHHDHARAVGTGHGRLAARRAWVIRDPEVLAFLDAAGRWPGRRASGLSAAARRVGAAREGERRHDLLRAPLAAAAFADTVRRHWGIEHRGHWVLDVTCNADASRVRAGHAAQHLAVLRRLALNLLRHDRTRRGSVAAKRFRAALDQDYLAALLADALTPASPGGQ
jgi:predicted transposase YbfD/YdcC